MAWFVIREGDVWGLLDGRLLLFLFRFVLFGAGWFEEVVCGL